MFSGGRRNDIFSGGKRNGIFQGEEAWYAKERSPQKENVEIPPNSKRGGEMLE